MKGRSALLGFIVRIRASLLHELVQRIAYRAYATGYKAAKDGLPEDGSTVKIDPSQIRKFQP